jgi:hypothetical protein
VILVDTSVWVDHLRAGDRELARLLERNQARMHPFVVGELACGNLSRRREVLDLLRGLPPVPVADSSTRTCWPPRCSVTPPVCGPGTSGSPRWRETWAWTAHRGR